MNNPIARKEKLVVQEMPDEVLVYDLKQHKAHCLNKTAAFVWNQCDGQTTIAELAQLAGKEFKTPFDKALVWRALDQLDKAGLLEVKLERPTDIVLQSRRRLLGKLGVGALLSVPVVMTIVAPTVQAGASVPAPCVACVKKSTGITACPSVCDANVLGTCHNNGGCADSGIVASNVTCASCFTDYPTPGSQSWTVG